MRNDQDLAAEAGFLDKAILAAVSKESAMRDAAVEQRTRDRLAEIATQRATLQGVFSAEFPDYAALSNSQPKYATLAASRLHSMVHWRATDLLLEANPKPRRRLHAKLFGFETATDTFWLASSPNATLAAIEGKNTESALWFSTPEPATTVLSPDAFSIAPIAPDKFDPGVSDEPRNVAPVLLNLSIASATLQEGGDIDIEYDAVNDLQNVTLRLTNADEALPALSLPVRGERRGKERIELNGDQLSQIRAAAVCELKGDVDGRQEFSNRIVLVQLSYLLKDPSSSDSDKRNPLRKVTETGEGLVPYMDSLGSVRDVVEFLNQCSIRFEDGTPQNRGFGSARWKPRDPFTGDMPPHWLAIPAGTSAAELRKAIWDFVERHQDDKLMKHVRRGNLSGLPNFIDIFRTLNGLLLTYHRRSLDRSGPAIPHPYVIAGILKNLSLFIGDFDLEKTHVRDSLRRSRSTSRAISMSSVNVSRRNESPKCYGRPWKLCY